MKHCKEICTTVAYIIHSAYIILKFEQHEVWLAGIRPFTYLFYAAYIRRTPKAKANIKHIQYLVEYIVAQATLHTYSLRFVSHHHIRGK